jgi:hypothetical protein
MLPSALRIQGVVNDYTGRTYIFYDNQYFAEISDFNFSVLMFRKISDYFIGMPTNFNGVFRYIDGFLYFFHNENIYIYNQFLKRVERVVEKNLSIFDISCPRESLLEQLKRLLSKIISTNVQIPPNY